MSTKTPQVAVESSVVAANGSKAGTWKDVRAADEVMVLVSVLNGVSAPVIGCTVRIDLSPDNGVTIYQGAGGSWTAGIAASTLYGASFEFPRPVMYMRVVFIGNTANAVTVQADLLLYSNT